MGETNICALLFTGVARPSVLDMQKHVVPKKLFRRKASHQFRLRDDVTLHRFLELATFCAGGNIKRSVQRKNFEKISMRP